MANKANLANAIIGSAVATGDTSITLQAGYGSTMPAVPFYATITPFGQLSTMGNSEIVSVTAVSGDTMTVTRAQKGTTAKAFTAGDVFSNGIYVEDLNSIAGDLDVDGDIYTNGSKVMSGSKYTDANGWTVYDYGDWKEYSKNFAYTLTTGPWQLETQTLPSGVTTGDVQSFTSSVSDSEDPGSMAIVTGARGLGSGTDTTFMLYTCSVDGANKQSSAVSVVLKV